MISCLKFSCRYKNLHVYVFSPFSASHYIIMVKGLLTTIRYLIGFRSRSVDTVTPFALEGGAKPGGRTDSLGGLRGALSFGSGRPTRIGRGWGQGGATPISPRWARDLTRLRLHKIIVDAHITHTLSFSHSLLHTSHIFSFLLFHTHTNTHSLALTHTCCTLSLSHTPTHTPSHPHAHITHSFGTLLPTLHTGSTQCQALPAKHSLNFSTITPSPSSLPADYLSALQSAPKSVARVSSVVAAEPSHGGLSRSR